MIEKILEIPGKYIDMYGIQFLLGLTGDLLANEISHRS
jgi:hypothetical protein